MTIQVVQKNQVVAYTPASQSLSFSTLPSVGNAVLVAVSLRQGSASQSLSVADNQGNSYSQIVQSTSAHSADAELWWCPSIGASSGTFTVTVTPADSYSSIAMGIAEVSGLGGSIDQTGTKTDGGTSGTSVTVTASAANANPNDLVVCVLALSLEPTPNGLSDPPSSGYTDLYYYDPTSPTNYLSASAAQQTVSAIQTSSASWTWTVSNKYAAAIATLKGAATSSGVQFVTVTSNTTLSSSLNAVLVNAASGNVTITLPTAVGTTGEYYVKRIDNSSNTVTIATIASQTIDGNSTVQLQFDYTSVTLLSNNANWFIT